MSDEHPCCRQRRELAAEVEWLNKVVIRGMAGVELSEENDRLIDDNKRLATENERLRAALEQIDGINDNPACFRIDIDQIIRRALEPSPPPRGQAPPD